MTLTGLRLLACRMQNRNLRLIVTVKGFKSAFNENNANYTRKRQLKRAEYMPIVLIYRMKLENNIMNIKLNWKFPMQKKIDWPKVPIK